jgi:diadenosine tetraphosphate (Ap4A) HIT family hydrolase
LNPTIEKFGYPATLIREFGHWVVLLRPAQVTLGSLVLAAKGDATGYGELSRDAFAEQAEAVAARVPGVQNVREELRVIGLEGDQTPR